MYKIFFITSLFILLVLTGCSSKQAVDPSDQAIEDKLPVKTAELGKEKVNDYPMSSAETVADKLEVYYFHSTARCNSCKTIGRYVKETMEQKYSEQIKEGKIDYREINVEEPANFDIARKFQASGSSLRLNKIIGEQDDIEEDTMVWRLLGDEAAFKAHLEAQINSYLGI